MSRIGHTELFGTNEKPEEKSECNKCREKQETPTTLNISHSRKINSSVLSTHQHLQTPDHNKVFSFSK